MLTPFNTGGVIVNVSQNRIIYNDKPLDLQPKVLELLVLLCAAKGQTLSKQELTEALWPDTVVGPDSLANTIAKLRRVLADDAKSPKFIKTVQRKGYLWLQDVSIIKAAANNTHRYGKAITYLCIVAALISFGLYWFVNDNQQAEEFPFPDLYIEKLEGGGYEIQVGVEGELTEERKAAMLKEIKRITGEEHSDMIFTVDPLKPDCEQIKARHKDKSECKKTLQQKSQ
ncbi:putative transcriptional regulator, CadC [Thalassotalea sp. ND16A]|nr:putative transcriptional regulator, CadC [Thalassotalea sp. ND16A]